MLLSEWRSHGVHVGDRSEDVACPGRDCDVQILPVVARSSVAVVVGNGSTRSVPAEGRRRSHVRVELEKRPCRMEAHILQNH